MSGEPPGPPAPEEVPAAPPPRWWLSLYWLLPAIAYAALIFWISSQPRLFPRLSARVWDKLLHFMEYAAFAVMLTWGLSHAGLRLARAARWAALLGSLYGLTDEIHQRFVPHRSGDLGDWLADTLGASLGALLAWLALRRWKARASIRR